MCREENPADCLQAAEEEILESNIHQPCLRMLSVMI